jgi:LCP family protein required for cell wall assembly
MRDIVEHGTSSRRNASAAPVQRRRRAWAALLLLSLLPGILAGCGATPTRVGVVTAELPSPTPSLSATWTALPTVQAAPLQTRTPTFTPSITPTGTRLPTDTATFTTTPSPTPSVTRTATPSGPKNTPTETLTPTATITPTQTPTLTPTPIYSPTPLPTVSFSDNIMHLLLVGLDFTQNLGSQNTDVIIVVVINKDTKQVSLLSIPRDLWVYIPTVGWSRINVAHKIGHRTGYPGGGPGLLAETIRVNFGLPVDHWGRLDFRGFTRVVDELGGVEMTVACPVNLLYKPPTSEEEQEMILEPGVYQMDGQTALRYVRTRRGTSDFDRAHRQQEFLKAMWNQTKEQFKGLDWVPKIRGLWTALRDSFETDLNLLDFLSLVPTALEMKPQRIRSRYIGSGQTTGWVTADGWQVLLPDYAKIQQVVAGLYAPPAATEFRSATVRTGSSWR